MHLYTIMVKEVFGNVSNSAAGIRELKRHDHARNRLGWNQDATNKHIATTSAPISEATENNFQYLRLS